MKYKILLFISVSLIIFAFRYTSDPVFVKPAHFPEPVYDFSKNSLSEAKVQLGRVLFYDPMLSRNGTISCASCHSQYSAFAHVDHALSHGINDQIGFRNAPALMNLAWQNTFMRDGAVHHLDMLALAPIGNPLEMDETLAGVLKKMSTETIYLKLFYQAFGDSMPTGERTLKALSQFMLTFVSAASKYDSVKLGHSTFTQQEANGYELFKAYCASCHSEPLFTNDDFKNNGLKPDTSLKDYGRYRVTHKPEDSLKFKVPTLRNIEFTYPYMHDGRFKNLKEVMNHYLIGLERNKTLSSELQKPILLSSNQKVDVVAFLLTLSDKSFLYNPKYAYPREIFSELKK